MSSVKRLFVEKRPGFDVEARHMLADLRENLGIAALEAIRVVNRYDLEGVDEADFDRASRTILSDNSNEFSFLSSKGDIIQRQLFRMGIAIFQMFYF